MQKVTILGLIGAAILTFGCGGSKSGLSSSTGVGRLKLSIEWPARTRLVPNAANSIVVTVSIGSQQFNQTVIPRPGNGQTESSETIDSIPVGSVVVVAEAHPNVDGSGVAQAIGSAGATISPTALNTINVTLSSTVTNLGITPSSIGVGAESQVPVSLEATDSQGRMVLLAVGSAAESIQWASNSESVVKVTGTGPSATVTGVAPGSTLVTATLKTTDAGATVTTTATVSVGSETYAWVSQWGSNAQFFNPYGIAVDQLGHVYIADTFNQRVEEYDEGGNLLTQWGSKGSGQGQFNAPYGIGVDHQGFVYVVDGQRIEKFSSAGSFILEWGTPGTGPGQFTAAVSIAFDSQNNVYVVDEGDGSGQYQRIEKFSSAGTFLMQWGSQGNSNGQFQRCTGITIDSNDVVYVADYPGARIDTFTSNGTYLNQWGTPGAGIGQFNGPYALAVDRLNNIYVTDVNNDRVQKFNSAGVFLGQFGSAGGLGHGQLQGEAGLAVDSAGTVLVISEQQNLVQLFQRQ